MPSNLQKKYKNLMNDQNFIILVQSKWNEHCKFIYNTLKSNINFSENLYYIALKKEISEENSVFTSLSLYFLDNELYVRINCDIKEIVDYLVFYFDLEEFLYHDSATYDELNISKQEYSRRKIIKEQFISGLILNIVYYENYKFDFYPSFKKISEDI